MTIDEYKRYFDELIMSCEGSYGRPSGEDKNGLYFSCAKPPIYVPHPERLTEQQRQLIVDRASERYAFPNLQAGQQR